jgi:hypothetical protein
MAHAVALVSVDNTSQTHALQMVGCQLPEDMQQQSATGCGIRSKMLAFGPVALIQPSGMSNVHVIGIGASG